jgi:hypothetical protein
MKKWIVPLLSLLFICVLIYLTGPFHFFKITVSKRDGGEGPRMMMTQSMEKDETEPQSARLYKEIQEMLDGWLKSLNERIERQDVSKIEVRFLEVLRNILEWVKEKVDAKVDSLKMKAPKKKGPSQETRLRDIPLRVKG